jgi:hypothetical protein
MFDATDLRDAALDLVSKPSWMDMAFERFKVLRLPPAFTGEDIRLRLMMDGMDPPHHHNAWGAFTMKLVRANLIEATGNFTQMKDPSSHSRITREYRRTVELGTAISGPENTAEVGGSTVSGPENRAASWEETV